MIREIVLYPDPILQRPTEKIVAFDEELRTLAADMFESMYKAIGIGLAAPQIGVSKRITVIDVSNKTNPEDKIVLVNPEIIHREGKQDGEEGCLSLPDIRDKVTRAAKVTVKAQDLDGNWFEMDGDRAAGPRLPARDRSPRRHPLSVARQRAQARPDPAQDSQAAKNRRVEMKLVFCGTPSFAVPTLKSALARRP